MPECRYNNFDVTISGGEPPYVVAASYRRLSAQGTFRFDARQPEWQQHLARLSQSFPPPGEERIAQVGGSLFAELIQADVRDLWRDASRDLDGGELLRVRLTLHPPTVAALPWETLTDPRRQRILAADDSVALIRVQNQVGYVGRARALDARLPLRILVAAVDDPDDQIDHAHELEIVRRILAPLLPRQVDLQIMGGPVGIHDLRERLLAEQPDVLHIITHGIPDGLLLWQGDTPGIASANQLRATLQQVNSLKLVFLNACLAGQPHADRPFASVAQRILQADIPAVIAMQFEILDRSAAEFAAHLYRALVDGPCPGAIDAAVGVARNNLYISRPRAIDYATPILWLNTEDGIIFRLPGADEARTGSSDGTDPAPAEEAAASASPPQIDLRRRLGMVVEFRNWTPPLPLSDERLLGGGERDRQRNQELFIAGKLRESQMAELERLLAQLGSYAESTTSDPGEREKVAQTIQRFDESIRILGRLQSTIESHARPER